LGCAEINPRSSYPGSQRTGAPGAAGLIGIELAENSVAGKSQISIIHH
jgi:hypothetical protein